MDSYLTLKAIVTLSLLSLKLIRRHCHTVANVALIANPGRLVRPLLDDKRPNCVSNYRLIDQAGPETHVRNPQRVINFLGDSPNLRNLCLYVTSVTFFDHPTYPRAREGVVTLVTDVTVVTVAGALRANTRTRAGR